MSIRWAARLAGGAVVAAQLVALASLDPRPAGLVAWLVVLAGEAAVVYGGTNPRYQPALRAVAPAALTGVAAAATWTALAFAAPGFATGNAAALDAIAVAGLVVAAWPPRPTGRRLLRLAAIASATTALLIFLVVTSVLPAVPGFVSNNHPPTFTDVTRLVDPVGELGIAVLLALALGADRWVAARRRRSRGDHGRPAELNDMVVVPVDPTQP